MSWSARVSQLKSSINSSGPSSSSISKPSSRASDNSNSPLSVPLSAVNSLIACEVPRVTCSALRRAASKSLRPPVSASGVTVPLVSPEPELGSRGNVVFMSTAETLITPPLVLESGIPESIVPSCGRIRAGEAPESVVLVDQAEFVPGIAPPSRDSAIGPVAFCTARPASACGARSRHVVP